MTSDRAYTVAVLPGDGIGPEVTREAVAAVDAAGAAHGFHVRWSTHDFGGVAIDRHGPPLPDATLAACRAADAVLLGAVGGPRWVGGAETPETGLLAIRKALGLFANLRPARVDDPALSPLKAGIAAGADVLVVRELTGGLYFGDKVEGDEEASDLCRYSRGEVERIAHVAFKAARDRRGRVTSVDKANVLATSRLWRRVVTAVAADYPDVALDHMYVDAAAMALVTGPTRFDVILTENLFGDILSDALSVLPGSIGLLGSASLGDGGPGMFEPIHGSAPDIAGEDRASPAGAIEAAAMMLDQLGETRAAGALRQAVAEAIAGGVRTPDLGGTARCSAFGAAVRGRIDAAARVAA
ncbi:3-isopropylmalate dehydrogenase [Sphingomonas jejuensis]|uniref:3-isopropylmalate dehydrogenase n=1 Tax=Sphingomonas jejuensis TaxID=904715 RepID=A0ABX0XKJ0_9SPHN|nr:3-isopropylmalate dehydrogenase [Sphingomonas jejuensis]NJC33683.1 3-isopropylmalate dehydrogenase [Sphingomonas jejuensis]